MIFSLDVSLPLDLDTLLPRKLEMVYLASCILGLTLNVAIISIILSTG